MEAVARLLDDEDIRNIPELVAALQNPEKGINPFIVDLLLRPLRDEF
jgi:cytochrome c553